MGNSADALEQQETKQATPRGTRNYGLLSHVRSYLFFDPLIWLCTVLFGIASIPFGFLDKDGRILHAFASAWAKVTMKVILSPFRVHGLEQIGWLIFAAEETAGTTAWLKITSATEGKLAMGEASQADLHFDGSAVEPGDKFRREHGGDRLA